MKVKILTGDNALVTREDLPRRGLEVERIVTGAELARLSPGRFRQTVREQQRLRQALAGQKEEIIQASAAAGHVVGFMGDGINDAPALKAADVGISVDSAVDVAKEAADIVLLEKSLLVLEEGIIEGRQVFANIVKYIRMGASSNFGNMFSVVGASYFLPFLPMQPVQILTNNLLYDVSQTGIPTDNVDEELIARPRKWNIGNIKRFMMFIGPISSIFDYATFALMLFFFRCSAFLDPAASRPHRKRRWRSLFQTGWFVESLLTQTLIVHIIRTQADPLLREPGVAAHDADHARRHGGRAPGCPIRRSPGSLGFVPLPAVYWLWIAAFLVVVRRADARGEDLVLQAFRG